MFEAVKAERSREHAFGDPEPDYSKFIPKYKPGQPWPWRVETVDA